MSRISACEAPRPDVLELVETSEPNLSTSYPTPTRIGLLRAGRTLATVTVGPAQPDLRFDDFVTLLDQFLGDVRVGDRAKQTTVNAGLLGQLAGRATELLADGLRLGQFGGSGLFEFGALGFELQPSPK